VKAKIGNSSPRSSASFVCIGGSFVDGFVDGLVDGL
jgi:hypothetical protein